eukprot:7934575-Pyramimonas_sp.AAC.1
MLDSIRQNAHHQILSSIDWTFISFPCQVCGQLEFSGAAAELPEVLHRRGLSDHAPVRVQLATSMGAPPEE